MQVTKPHKIDTAAVSLAGLLASDTYTANNSTVIPYEDRRGFSRSTQPSQGRDFDASADDLAALVETLDPVDVTFVGHSLDVQS